MVFDIVDFNDVFGIFGNLWVDYVLFLIDWEIVDIVVFWFIENDVLFLLVGDFFFFSLDYCLVWVDIIGESC